MKLYTFS